MSFHKRSTNERVLARHHLKRFPAPVDPSFPTRHSNTANPDTDESDDNDSDLFSGLLAEVEGSTAAAHAATTSAVHATTSVKPVVSVLPPIGTAKPATSPSTTAKAATSPSVASTPTPSSSSSASSSSPSVPATTSSPSSSASSLPPTGNRDVSSPSTATHTTNAAPEISAPPSSQSSKGVPPGAVGAIVAVIIILAVGLAAFFVRKQYQRRRAMKRNTWGAGLVPSLENKRDTVYAGQPFSGQTMPPSGGVPPYERLQNVPMASEMSQTPAPQAFGIAPGFNAQSSGLSHPASSYNPGSPPPVSPFATPTLRAPSLRSVAPGVSSMSVPTAVEIAVVARTFIPSLPDELHISNGEQIRVLSAYDDGWALCSNLRGDQGVVPLECLERSTGAPAEMQLQPQSEFGYDSSRTSRRMSSLTPHAEGTY